MHYLGIEIGGTKLQLGIGPGDGTLRGLWRGSVDVARGAEGIRAQITDAVPELVAKAGLSLNDLRGAGIGFGGPVDDSTHTVIKSHQIQGWDNFHLADWITDLVGLPAILGNDADVAGLAEALFGAGKGLSPIFYITIGSGIGGGLIINGEIYRGCGRGAAEIGHLKVHPGFWWGSAHPLDGGMPVETMSGSCLILEHVASGWAIGNEVRKRALVEETELLELTGGKPELITSLHVAIGAERGEPVATSVLRESLDCLAEGIIHVITLLCPRRIIIGGGVSLMGEQLLFEPLRRLVVERVFAPFRDCYDIVPAALGEEVVVHGALALARRYFPDK
jgi:glucokinase